MRHCLFVLMFLTTLHAREEVRQPDIDAFASKPDITFKELIEFANSKASVYPVSVSLPAPSEYIPGNVVTPCKTIETELPFNELGKIEPSKILVNGESFVRFGQWQPYSMNLKERRFNFMVMLGLKTTQGEKLHWWHEVIEHNPELKTYDPFLLAVSHKGKMHFSANFADYIKSEHFDVRATTEELKKMPYGKVFWYKNENVRVQMPVSCL